MMERNPFLSCLPDCEARVTWQMLVAVVVEVVKHDVGYIILLMNSTWFINVRNEIKPLLFFDI